MNFESEQVKGALKHMRNIKRFARDLQDAGYHYKAHANIMAGLTEIILRLDDAIEEAEGVKLSDDDDGLLLEVVQ